MTGELFGKALGHNRKIHLAHERKRCRRGTVGVEDHRNSGASRLLCGSLGGLRMLEVEEQHPGASDLVRGQDVDRESRTRALEDRARAEGALDQYPGLPRSASDAHARRVDPRLSQRRESEPARLVLPHRPNECAAESQTCRGEQRGCDLTAGQQLLGLEPGLLAPARQPLDHADPVEGDLAEPQQVEGPRFVPQ